MKHVLFVLLALSVVPAHAAAQAPSTPEGRRLVIPFENLRREPRLYWLTEGSAVALTDDLIALGAPAITRDDRLRAFDRLQVPAVASLSDATVIRLGGLVGASEVVLGSFEVLDDQITVRARTIRLDAGRLTPEIVQSGPLNDMFNVYARVARRLAPDSQVSTEQLVRSEPPLAAFEEYIKGLIAESPATRIAFLNQALRVAPMFHRARLALWDLYNEAGDPQKALATVRQIPVDDPLARQARFRESLSLINLQAWEQAYNLLTELNQAMPAPALLNDLGVVQLRRPPDAPGGRAVSFFAAASKLDASDPDLFFNLGYAYWVDHDLPNAVAALREAVRRNPADGQAHYVLAVALQANGRPAEASRERELARQLSSEYAKWETRSAANGPVPKGLERVKMDLDVSLQHLEDVLDTSGQREQREQAAFHLDAGRRLFKADRDNDAIAELRRAVFLAPYDSEAHLLLGRLYLKAGEVSQSIDELKISIWSEDTPAAHLALAQAYVAAKDYAAARTEVQTVLARDPSNTEARTILDKLP
jgi:Flp pilus assembly protein TadD